MGNAFCPICTPRGAGCVAHNSQVPVFGYIHRDRICSEFTEQKSTPVGADIAADLSPSKIYNKSAAKSTTLGADVILWAHCRKPAADLTLWTYPEVVSHQGLSLRATAENYVYYFSSITQFWHFGCHWWGIKKHGGPHDPHRRKGGLVILQNKRQ